MVTILKRTTDNKYLKSTDDDIWTENIKEAIELSYVEAKTIKDKLLESFDVSQIVEIVNIFKYKQITNDEKKELLSSLKR